MRMDACRLSYKGLGEPLCFLAFGPLATSAFYVAQVRCMAPAYHMFPDTLEAACSCVLPLTSRMLPCTVQALEWGLGLHVLCDIT